MTSPAKASEKADAIGSPAAMRRLRVAVVTPFHREPTAWLEACQRSVARQTHACTHVLVGDAATVQPPLPALVIPLPQGAQDWGDTPRAVGAMYAAGLGFDAIAFLDADNTFDAEHIASLVALHQQTGAVVLSARRRLVSLDGQPMANCLSSDGEAFCDTNCLMVMRPAFAQMAQWAVMDPAFHAIDDRVIWHALKAAGHARAHSPVVSVSYRVSQPGIYRDLGWPLPEGVRDEADGRVAQAVAAWAAAGLPSVEVGWRYKRLAPPPALAAVHAPLGDSTGQAGQGDKPPAPLAAIYYHPDAYTTTGPKLMGRNAAGEAFLRGWLAHGRAPAFWAQVESPAHARAFAQTVAQSGRTEPARCFDRQGLHQLADVGLMYLPGPGLGEAAWQRAPLGHAAWSLCGITHTTASARAMDAIADLVGAPVQPWDALICTSTAVKDNVQRILQAQSEHMSRRLGAQRFPLPMLPVIPLGVHTGDFAFTADQRAVSRQALGLGEHDVAVLFVGRLSFHAKAHPLAMYQALQAARAQLKAAGKLAGEVVLIECGWHANEAIAQAYAQAAVAACPDVRVHTLDGRQASARTQAWSAADVFCSLSDNIQETFGITPIEAMAAGLPLVVSDWDGYKDTVRHGVDGLRVPTLMPSAGQGQDLAMRHALELDNYDMYCGLSCALVAVDIGATTAAFVQLLGDPALRRRLGDAGRARAQQAYDWRHIMSRYEILWAQQHAQRLAAAPGHPAPSPQDQPWPARMDPWHAFAAYPTQPLRPDTPLALAAPDAQQAWARAQVLGALNMVSFAQAVMPSPTEIQQVLRAAQAAARPESAAMWGPQGGPAGFLPAAVLVQGIAPARRAQVFRGLMALVKWGLLRGPGAVVPAHHPDVED
jgi:starch synthase